MRIPQSLDPVVTTVAVDELSLDLLEEARILVDRETRTRTGSRMGLKLSIAWTRDRVEVPAAAQPIDMEVVIEREDGAMPLLLGIRDEGGVCEVHRPVGVLLH